MAPVAPVPPAPMAPGQIPVDLNMLVTPQQLDVLLHVARQQISTLQSQVYYSYLYMYFSTSSNNKKRLWGQFVILIIVIIITVICAFFNITSLLQSGIPAILCSWMVWLTIIIIYFIQPFSSCPIKDCPVISFYLIGI